jgi:hypothetical protein
MPFLTIVSGTLTGQKVEIGEQDVTVGRASDNTFPINDPTISQHHCVIRRREQAFVLSDMESTNGTFVNGAAVTETEVKMGDQVRLGSVDCVFGSGGEGAGAPRIDDTMVIAPAVQPSNGPRQSPFDTKHERRGLWVVILITLAVLAVAAGGWFVFQLLNHGRV